MIRAVIDTNVIVSALISHAGNEALVLLAVNQGLVVPCFCHEILEEYGEVLLRRKFDFSIDVRNAVLELFRRRGALIELLPSRGLSPDPGDEKFIACALAAKADFLVTGNKRHFPQETVIGTKVVSAGELLEFVTLGL